MFKFWFPNCCLHHRYRIKIGLQTTYLVLQPSKTTTVSLHRNEVPFTMAASHTSHVRLPSEPPSEIISTRSFPLALLRKVWASSSVVIHPLNPSPWFLDISDCMCLPTTVLNHPSQPSTRSQPTISGNLQERQFDIILPLLVSAVHRDRISTRSVSTEPCRSLGVRSVIFKYIYEVHKSRKSWSVHKWFHAGSQFTT